MPYALICMVVDTVSHALVKVRLREKRCSTQKQIAQRRLVMVSTAVVVPRVTKRPQMMDTYVVVETRIMQTKLGTVLR